MLPYVSDMQKYVTDQVFTLLGCYAAYFGSCLLTFQDSLSAPSSGVPIDYHRTSTNNYQQTLHNNPKKQRPHLHCGGTPNFTCQDCQQLTGRTHYCQLWIVLPDILTQWSNKRYKAEGILKIGTSHLITTSTEASLRETVRQVQSILS